MSFFPPRRRMPNHAFLPNSALHRNLTQTLLGRGEDIKFNLSNYLDSLSRWCVVFGRSSRRLG